MEGEKNLDQLLKAVGIELSNFTEERIKNGFILLFNIIDETTQKNEDLLEEIQNIKERLKGEDGKPKKKRDRKGEINLGQLLKGIGINLFNFADEKIKKGFNLLFNLIEELKQANRKLEKENQNLKDEINRLKGEDGKPKHKPKKNKNDSSEKERKSDKPKKKRKKKSKNKSLSIDETSVCKLDKATLPDDAVYKGTEPVIVQELIIKSHVIKFKRETYYSKQENKTYIAPLPPGYHGGFGPTLRSLVLILHYGTNVSEPKILELLRNFGIKISAGTISNILIKDTPDNEGFQNEKDDIYKAGLECGEYQQIDDTGVTVRGENRHAQIMCNPFYTAYFTTKNKDRCTIIDLLRNFKERCFVFNDVTLTLVEKLNIPKKIVGWLNGNITQNKEYTEEEIKPILDHLNDKNQRKKVYELLYLSSYHMEEDFIEILLSDDAKQFKNITSLQALCWVHDGRLYKKLIPFTPYNQRKLEVFLEWYWDYYKKLKDYKNNPSKEKAKELEEEFDSLFKTETGYEALDERIKSTYKKKENLLLVLQHPGIPLHNNESELAVRGIKRWLDVSLHTMTEQGTKARDVFLTIIATAKKLRVNALNYIIDRVKCKSNEPSLATLIKTKTSLS